MDYIYQFKIHVEILAFRLKNCFDWVQIYIIVSTILFLKVSLFTSLNYAVVDINPD